MREILNFHVVNNAAGLVPVSLFGNYGNLQDNANATTRYAYATIGAYTPTVGSTVELQYSTPSDPTLRIASTIINTPTTQGIADALNSLNLGLFFVTNYGLGNILESYTQNFVYGYINIYTNGLAATTLLGFLTDAADTLILKINAATVASFSGAVTLSGTYSANVGDTFNVSGTAGAAGLSLYVYQDPDNLLLTNLVVPPATPYSYSWTAVNTKSYRVQTFP